MRAAAASQLLLVAVLPVRQANAKDEHSSKHSSSSKETLKCEGTQKEVSDCGNAMCDGCYPTDCVWGQWSEYGPCTCEGLQERHRGIDQENNECGKPCSGSKVETVTCHPECVKDPVDCKLSEWSYWSDCDKECDGGQRTRTREITTEEKNGGKPCKGSLKETKECNTRPCHSAADCQLSEWSSWGECSKSCGGGQQQKTRTIEVAAKFGGQPCTDPLVEIQGCNEQVCEDPVDCQWGEWSSYSACSKTCNGGEKTRSRLITVAPRAGGKLCDDKSMSEVAPCALETCETPVDCELSEWSDWDDCSCSCNGIHARARYVSTYPLKGGKPCDGSLKEIKSCNVDNCNIKPTTPAPSVDCALGSWSDWTSCSVTCGGGEQTRNRIVFTQPKYGGKICSGDLKEIRGCNTEVCVNEDGHKTVKDCVWSDWDSWGACSVTCGGGQKVRERQVMTMPNKYGSQCAPDEKSSMEISACNVQPCVAVDCQWGDWSDWGACTCTGLMERHRSIGVHQQGAGKLCEGPKVETQRCENPECVKEPQDCVLSEWDSWSQCTAACGGGQTYRTRGILKEAKNGGKTCENDVMKETKPCNEEVCAQPIDCEVSAWEPWSSCSATCNGGQRFRRRVIEQHAAAGGKSCDYDLEEVEACGTEPCKTPVDCVWGNWEGWSDCSASCGGGQKSRDRHVSVSPRNGGKLCEAKSKEEVAPCNTHECGEGCVDGVWGAWSYWGACSASCGEGYQVRSRKIDTPPNHCGAELEGMKQEFQKCNERECSDESVDCVFSDWTAFGDCTDPCNGIKDRTRRITQTSSKGGKPCDGATKEVEPCNIPGDGTTDYGENCKNEPVDCVLGEWSYWSDCSAECEGGSQVRTRDIVTKPKGSGKPCEGSLEQVQGCNAFVCSNAVDCEWGEWQGWGACSKACGGGEKSRFRHIITMPKHSGKPCDHKKSVEVEPCNMQVCGEVQYCGWGEWSGFSECSTTCGPGQMTRTRKLGLTTSQPYEDSDVMVTGILASVFQSINTNKLDHLLLVFFAGMAMSIALLALAYAGIGRMNIRGGALGATVPGADHELLEPQDRDEPVE
ncbi:unnamed protein product [Amoebophrya sp. A120]|nr:unnamed protein product [Amoebophrya sp. A120]|eukprot:GSA120T00020269001.1